MKAQAIAARTYALYQKRTAGRRPYDIVATVNSQVYEGSKRERPREAQAMKDTMGLVLVYGGGNHPCILPFQLWWADGK